MLFIANRRAWAIFTAAAGLLTLAITWKFTQLPEVLAAGACMKPGAIIHFEFARSAAELNWLFGPSGGACRGKAVAAMDAINQLDLMAYIPAYTTFGVCAALWLMAGRIRLLPMLAVLAALAAAACDVLETTTLLKLSHSLEAPDALLPTLAWGAWGKFFLLAVHALLLGLHAIKSKRRLLGFLLLLPLPGVLLARWNPLTMPGYMNLAFVLAWTPMLLLALREAVWPPKEKA